MRQKIEIEVDIPDGWEFVRYRLPKKGEQYIGGEKVSIATFDFANVVCCIIVRPTWKWPPCLKANWIAMDEMGQWHAYRNEPREAIAAWAYDGPRLLIEGWIDFTPPPCTDWRQSKRRRPS